MLLEYAQGDGWKFCQMMGTRLPFVVILSCLRSPLHNLRDGIKIGAVPYIKTCEQEALWSTLKKLNSMHSATNSCA
jgi:hypothetical protein